MKRLVVAFVIAFAAMPAQAQENVVYNYGRIYTLTVHTWYPGTGATYCDDAESMQNLMNARQDAPLRTFLDVDYKLGSTISGCQVGDIIYAFRYEDLHEVVRLPPRAIPRSADLSYLCPEYSTECPITDQVSFTYMKTLIQTPEGNRYVYLELRGHIRF